MKSLLKNVSQLLESGGAGVLVTVVAGPDNVGRKLLFVEDERIFGSLGNPALDSQIVSQARLFLSTNYETRTFRLSEFVPDAPAPDLQFLFERIRPEPRLVVCGAGHVGAALVQLARIVGYSVTIIDDRAEFLEPSRFPLPGVSLTVADDWHAAVQTAVGDGRGVAVAVVTRGHKEDEECLRAILKTPVDYIGLIGSKRRTTIVIERLRASGASEEQTAMIHAPIGLDIGAVTPEEVALAIISEIVCQRRGGKGGSLSEWRRSKVRSGSGNDGLTS